MTAFQIANEQAALNRIRGAMTTAESEAQTVHTTVAQATAGMPWSGDAAATYANSITNWLNGLIEVRRGLTQLNSAMEQHQQATVRANAQASQDASF